MPARVRQTDKQVVLYNDEHTFSLENVSPTGLRALARLQQNA